jgi:hypothetical protein
MKTNKCAKKPAIKSAPIQWKESCTHSETTLHQLSPYIGKIKSSIAGELIELFTKKGDLVVDPFSGAGTIPLEATIRGRRAFCSDISPYSRVLTVAKLIPPQSVDDAVKKADEALNEAQNLPVPDLRKVPFWVKQFFHPETLREIVKFAEICRKPGNEFLFACFLGILHHQRPGFLSYPSSHLVPYLRDKKYPRSEFPSMYEYRELRPRLIEKIKRIYKRFVTPEPVEFNFQEIPVQELNFPSEYDALITSPPYMNALDYGRDNRLRLWFINSSMNESFDGKVTRNKELFIEAIGCVANNLETGLKKNGYCIFVVGEELRNRSNAHPSEMVISIFKEKSPSLRLYEIITDDIPDIRRTRRECKGIKTEHILIFRKG